MRPGVRIGVDVGSVRVGVATCDPYGMLATPVETLARDRHDLDRLAALVAEREAVEVVVGLPRSMSGAEGPAARAAREYAVRLAAAVAPVRVRMVDERLSTVAATGALRANGVSVRKGRSVIDQAAAVVILQLALDAERATGRPPGLTVGAG